MTDLFIPGRICLFGEHSDWAAGYRITNPNISKGYAIIVGTDQGLYAHITAQPDLLMVTSVNHEGTVMPDIRLPMEKTRLLEVAKLGNYDSYVAGVAYQVLSRYTVAGLMIDNYRTDLPIRKGLSSSAAISVLTARAFNISYHLGLSVNEEMELAYLGERTTPSRCGRMDQGCAYGKKPILMTFDGDSVEITPLTTGNDIHLVIVDLGGAKDTVKILGDLHSCYPLADSREKRNLQELLGTMNYNIITKAKQYIKAGNPELLGALMTEAQKKFDAHAIPVCPTELTAPILHRLLTHPVIKPYITGGKGVGSQGDGTAQFVTRNKKDQSMLIKILNDKFNLTAYPLTMTKLAVHQ